MTRNTVFGLFLDLRKTFDVCSHSIILKQLRKYGIIEWLTTGLLATEKTEKYVDMDGHSSTDQSIFTNSQIQGSLFIHVKK